MIKKLMRRFQTLVLEKPTLGAVVVFLSYVPIFCLIRFVVHPDDFLSAPWIEILYSAVFGILTATLTYVLAVHTKGRK